MALRTDDYMVGTHRSHGHRSARAPTVKPLVAELLASTGSTAARADRCTWPTSGSAAWARRASSARGCRSRWRRAGRQAARHRPGGARLLRRRSVNEGAFHDAQPGGGVEPAGGLRLREQRVRHDDAAPLVAVPNIADRAASYAMPGKIVDGQECRAGGPHRRRWTGRAAATDRASSRPRPIATRRMPTGPRVAHAEEANGARATPSPSSGEAHQLRRRLEAELAAVQAAVEEEITAAREVCPRQLAPRTGRSVHRLRRGQRPCGPGDPRW